MEIFCSYAHEDQTFVTQLYKYLTPLRRKYPLILWKDTDIIAGSEWKDEIQNHLNSAEIILLFISPDFMHSEYCYSQELKQAMERHESRQARIIPIILRPADWKDAPFSKLQPLPTGGKPVTSKDWHTVDDPFLDIAAGIRLAVEKIIRDSSVNSLQTPPLQTHTPVVHTSSQHKKRLLVLLSIFIAAIVITATIFTLRSSANLHTGNDNVQKASDGEYIGISDGSFAFDTSRPGGNLKQEATKNFKAGDTANAKSKLEQAHQLDTSDAETLIYLENLHVLASGSKYITLVVATILTGSYTGVGRDDLQGAYVAQKEFNDGSKLPNGYKVRLLIASSSSSDETNANRVAGQIVQAAATDKTIIGVMGWPFSQSTLSALDVLKKANIPMVSETASTDQLSSYSKYFFRVVSPDKIQGSINAHYVEQKFHAKRVALFVDYSNPYSATFAKDFQVQYLANGNGNNIVATEQYTVSKPSSFRTLLQDALSQSPDLIYFAGYAADLSVLLANLPSSGPGAGISVMGGETFYELDSYTSTARANLSHLHFTASAYPDEWDVANLKAQKPSFFIDYPIYFQSIGHPDGSYGHARATNDVMLSYDATLALLTGCYNVLNNTSDNISSINSDELQHSLAQITSNQPLQGVSGEIAFGSDGNPVHKPILALYIDANNHIHEDSLLTGCLQVKPCT